MRYLIAPQKQVQTIINNRKNRSARTTHSSKFPILSSPNHIKTNQGVNNEIVQNLSLFSNLYLFPLCPISRLKNQFLAGINAPWPDTKSVRARDTVPGRQESPENGRPQQDAHQYLSGKRGLTPFTEQLAEPPGQPQEDRYLDEEYKDMLFANVFHAHLFYTYSAKYKYAFLLF